jgi:predicted aspartyl protease
LLVAAGAAFAVVAQAQPKPEVPQTSAFQVQFHFPPPAERKPVPFELVHNHILFKARVEGRDTWAMLDTGLAETVVDTRFARASGLNVGPTAGEARTTTGHLDRQLLLHGARIEIPGQLDVRPPVSAVDLSSVSALFGRPVSLVIGRDLFDILAFFVSATGGSFQLSPSGTLHVPPGTPQLELKNGEGQLDVTIAGKPAVLTVDLGSDAGIGLSKSAWDRLGLTAAAEGKSVGADGRLASTKSAVVASVSIGPIQGRNLSVTAGPMLPDFGDGIIGMGFFSGYDFVIDLNARRIWLSPVAGHQTTAGSAR